VRQGGGAEAGAGVAGGGLHEEAREGTVAEEAPVGHHVEGDAPRHAEVGQAGLVVKPGGLGEQHLLEHRLEAPRDVLVEAGDLRLGAPRRCPEEPGEGVRVHPPAAHEIEIVEVEPVLPAAP
jgi:hypothetical protein